MVGKCNTGRQGGTRVQPVYPLAGAFLDLKAPQLTSIGYMLL